MTEATEPTHYEWKRAFARGTPYQNRSTMQSIEFPTWLEGVKTGLAEVELQYDLKLGEMMQASNTSAHDLVELHSYGWTAAETTACIVDRAGLR